MNQVSWEWESRGQRVVTSASSQEQATALTVLSPKSIKVLLELPGNMQQPEKAGRRRKGCWGCFWMWRRKRIAYSLNVFTLTKLIYTQLSSAKAMAHNLSFIAAGKWVPLMQCIALLSPNSVSLLDRLHPPYRCCQKAKKFTASSTNLSPDGHLGLLMELTRLLDRCGSQDVV